MQETEDLASDYNRLFRLICLCVTSVKEALCVFPLPPS